MTTEGPILAWGVAFTSLALKQTLASAATARARPNRLIKTS